MPTLEAVHDAVTHFDPVTFHREHTFHGHLAAVDAQRLGAITFVLDAGIWSYVPSADDVRIVEGRVDDASIVVEMDDVTFAGLALDVDTPVAMIIQSRVRVTHGKPMRFSRWEPALRALFHGRPVYDAAAVHLVERDGSVLDPAAVANATATSRNCCAVSPAQRPRHWSTTTPPRCC